MSDQDPIPKPSLKDRLKTHAPALIIGVAVGALAAYGFRSRGKMTTIILNQNEPGSVLLGPSVIESVKKHGSAMVDLAPGILVDLIDWSHPSNADQ